MREKNNLKAILYYEGISIYQLERKMDISGNSLHGYANGQHFPSVYRALEIANFLGYNVEEIWGNDCPSWVLEAWNNRDAEGGV